MMNKLLTIAVFGCALVTACSSPKNFVQENAENQAITASIQEGLVEVALYSKDKADTLESWISFMYFEQPSEHYQDSINQMIKTFVSDLVAVGEGFHQQDADLSKTYFEESLRQFKEEYHLQQELQEEGGVWQTETTIAIQDQYEGFVGLTLINWGYTGGAHGFARSEQHFLDRKNGKKLGVKDFFNDVEELTRVAEAVFRSKQGISSDQDLTEAGYWFEDGVFTLNDNFSFYDESIEFVFNQYEIAPYSMGAIFISLPMERIQHLLTVKVN